MLHARCGAETRRIFGTETRIFHAPLVPPPPPPPSTVLFPFNSVQRVNRLYELRNRAMIFTGGQAVFYAAGRPFARATGVLNL